jgi:hypothetical protein
MAIKGKKGDQFFHGTAHSFKEGDIVYPHRGLHGPSTGKHVYMTDRDIASEYADMAIEQLHDMEEYDPKVHKPRVYEVEPLGDVEVDPSGIQMGYEDEGEGVFTYDHRTSHMRIVRQVE